MELYFFNHAEYDRIYNCSRIIIEQVPIEKRRQHVAGVIIIALTVIYYVLYIPCINSIARQMRTKPCYQILFFMACADLSVLWIIGICHGIFALEGAVFCSHPTFIYFAGNFAVFGWMLESCAAIFLAINRCLEFMDQNFADRFFTSRLMWCWLCAISLLPIYRLVFEKPILFSAIYFEWYFNPFEGYLPDSHEMYHSELGEIMNYVVAICLPILYAIFAFTMFYKSRIHLPINGGSISNTNGQLFRTEMIISLQIFLISLMNSLDCFLFVLMQHSNIDWPWLDYLSHFAWLNIHGFPPVIYLLLNKTIRNDCRTLLFGKMLNLCQANKIQVQQNVLFVQPCPSDQRHSSAQIEAALKTTMD